jgi:hypothetical protein
MRPDLSGRESLVFGEPVVPVIPPCEKTCVQKRFEQISPKTQPSNGILNNLL